MTAVAWLDAAFQKDEGFYAALGVFTHKFGSVDLKLITLHAHVLGISNFEEFADGAKGQMTSGTRIRDLEADAKKQGEIGQNLQARINHYRDVVVELRNRILHDELQCQQRPIKMIAIDRYNPGIKEECRPSGRPERLIEVADIAHVAQWLDLFYWDIDDAISKSKGRWEIETPKSPPASGYDLPADWHQKVRRPKRVCRNCGTKI